MNGKKRKLKSEQYSIIITSETDARKHVAAFNMKRTTALIAVFTFILAVAAFVGFTVRSVFQASYYSAKSENLKTQVDVQSSILDQYSGEIESLNGKLDDWQLYLRQRRNEQ